MESPFLAAKENTARPAPAHFRFDRFAAVRQAQDLFRRPALDAVPAHIAILDDKGRIIVVNGAWRTFAERNGGSAAKVSEGVNYLKICDEAAGKGAVEAKPIAGAIRRILAGEKTAYQNEYPCHASGEDRWFLGCVAPFPGNGRRHVVVAHFDISETRRMRLALRESERRFRDAFTHAPVGMVLLDPDGRFVHVNAAYCRFTGFSEQELLQSGVTFQQLDHPDDMPEGQAQMRRMVAGMIPAFTIEKRCRRKDGTIAWARARVSLRRGTHGGPPLVVGLVENIDERKRAEKALEENGRSFRDADESANSIILRWDREGVIRFINDFGLRYFGYRNGELVGRHIVTILASRDRNSGWDLDAFIKDIDRHPDFFTSLPRQNRCRDGTTVWVAWTHKAFRDETGRVRGILAIGSDMTHLKAAEAALRLANLELEQFAYLASHDLQEPLRSVVEFLQLLQYRHPETIDDKGRHYIERSVRAGQHLQGLIRDLLALARVQTEGAPFMPTDLNRVLASVLDHLSDFLGARNTEVVSAALPTLRVDARQIQGLFRRLIMNAVQYNDSPLPRIEIGVRKDAAAYRFFVKDNGIGMAPGLQAHVFKLFQRRQSARESPGKGLGLALCQKIVERHGGTIWVESRPAQGSTFYFSLPRLRWDE